MLNKKFYLKIRQGTAFGLILVRSAVGGRTPRLLPPYFGFDELDYRQKNPFKCHILPSK